MTGSARHLAETAGYDTWQGVYKELWLTPTITKLLSHNSGFIADFLSMRQAIVQSARDAMTEARQRMMQQTDARRKALTFQVGDKVSLKTKHLGVSSLPSKKLFPKFMGPFEVTQVINDAAYRLALPSTWRAHNVFHVSLLRPYKNNGEPVAPMSYTLVGGKDDAWEVERILDFGPKQPKRTGAPRRVRDLHFMVKWLGLDYGPDAEQPYSNLKGSCKDALQELAQAWSLPAATFLRGKNVLPDTWKAPAFGWMPNAP